LIELGQIAQLVERRTEKPVASRFFADTNP
jgi:hypothetical protein